MKEADIGKQHTLLIVDDEPNVLRALVRLLRREGYELLTAASGPEGLDLLARHDAAVVISDFRMPEMTGVDFLLHVKDMAPDAVRVILSGYMDVSLITRAVNTGEVYRFITKPWDDEELKTLVRRSVEHFELVRQNRLLDEKLQATNTELVELNHTLEDKVEERTRELDLRNRALLLSQEVLDNLPTAVVGVNSDGTIVLVNQRALTQLASRVDGAPAGHTHMLGQDFAHCLPAEIAVPLRNALGQQQGLDAGRIQVADREFDVHIAPMGGASAPRGVILVAHEITHLCTDAVQPPAEPKGKPMPAADGRE